jgi:hypothetical protein
MWGWGLGGSYLYLYIIEKISSQRNRALPRSVFLRTRVFSSSSSFRKKERKKY